jgi:hypothetical protein
MSETEQLTLPVVTLACGDDAFRNTGPGMLKRFTTYCPPEHATKAQADQSE